MQSVSHWQDALANVLNQTIERLGQFLPNLLGAFLLLLVGWLIALLLRASAMRLISLFENLLSRLSQGRIQTAKNLSVTSTKILGSVIFWVVILFFLTAATQVLGLHTFTVWLSSLVDYLPTMFVGLLIVIAGFLVSKLAREIIEATAVNATKKQRAMFGSLVQIAILVTAIIIGAEQVGIKVTFLIILTAVAGASIVAAVALALSLGARDYVANLIGAHYLRQRYSIGQQVRLANFEGRILELTETNIILETMDGRVSIPAKVFNEQPITLLISHKQNG
jgi:small-conductance mechanosensitive channel